ncbi:MAG: histidine phosphatase family protein [Gammaproteobacteria bacterium]|nr:histidine phosphatase family protein [Gammaproteobacteria bacterium]
MCRILLVRHGQASFASDDYDNLSELGHKQAEVLGKFLRKISIDFSLVASGTLNRQQQTASELVKYISNSDSNSEDSNEDDSNEDDSNEDDSNEGDLDDSGLIKQLEWLNELDSHSLVQTYQEKLEYAQKEGRLEFSHDNFEQVFTDLVTLWSKDKEFNGESFHQFQSRILTGLAELKQQHDTEQTLLLVTSGGVIATIVQSILGLDNKAMLKAALRIFNGSLTEVIYHKNQWELVGFNSVAAFHLEQNPSLLTRL